jgi:hypothetical protein
MAITLESLREEFEELEDLQILYEKQTADLAKLVEDVSEICWFYFSF